MEMLRPGKTGKKEHSVYLWMMAILLTTGVVVSVLFTAIQMGVFAKEPEVESVLTTTDPDAPVLRVATDYGFCPNSYINSKGELSGLYIERSLRPVSGWNAGPCWNRARRMFCWALKFSPTCRAPCAPSL